MTTALFSGRFDPLHRGHLFQIVNILQECDCVTVIVRSSSTGNELFTLDQRLQISIKALSLLRDVAVLDGRNLFYRFDVVYTGNSEVAAMYPNARVVKIPRWPRYSATEIRRRLAAGEEIDELVCYGTAEMIQYYYRRNHEILGI